MAANTSRQERFSWVSTDTAQIELWVRDLGDSVRRCPADYAMVKFYQDSVRDMLRRAAMRHFEGRMAALVEVRERSLRVRRMSEQLTNGPADWINRAERLAEYLCSGEAANAAGFNTEADTDEDMPELADIGQADSDYEF